MTVALHDVWFALIAVLWVGYFTLEGFDFGVGMLLPVLAEDDRERRVMINTIGPVWDGNEVWVISAGAFTFAAFPEWYASMFSGFYLALLVILVCLIGRGVAFEYRGKGHSDRWRARWDMVILIASWLLALLWGVAFGNIVRGVPLNADHQYVGTFFDLLNPFALLMGLTTLGLFLTHGSVFLALKTTAQIRDRARGFALRLGPFVVLLLAAVVIWQRTFRGNVFSVGLGALAVVALVVALVITRTGRDGWAFIASIVATGALTSGWFAAMYPDVLPSNLNETWSLTIDNASSTPYTLTVMTWVALAFAPFVLAYQAWSYWVFRRRISAKQIPESPTSVPAH
jgi:cytochrome d ubiquinol oxidase subunit II